MRSTSKGAWLLLTAAVWWHAAEGSPVMARADGALPADAVRGIETAVKGMMAERGIPGMAVAVVMDGRILWQGASGVTDVENSVSAETSTLWRIASATKPITAVAAMQLVEKGALDLDAPVQKYVPSFPVKEFPLTARLLLCHQSGVRNYRRGEAETGKHYPSLVDALEIFKDDPLDHEPGTRYTYTTYGYTLLGVVIEGASGMPFPEYLKKHVLEPAGMRSTFVDDVYAILPHRARGYQPKVYGVFDGQWRNASLLDSSYKIPGGGLVSTAEDMARFAIAVLDGRLVTGRTFETMSVNQKTRDGQPTGYGYGWYIDGREGREPSDGSVHHGGVQPGFTSDFWLLPRRHLAIAILTNLEGGGRLGLATLANRIAAIVLDDGKAPAPGGAATLPSGGTVR